MTNVLFAGDLHGDLGTACRVVDMAVKHETGVVIQAGDFGLWTHTQSGVRYLRELDNYLAKHFVTMYFVDGNHENFDHLYDIPMQANGLRYVTNRIIHIPRGHVMQIDGVRIMGFGGANSIDGPNGASWWGVQSRGPVDSRHFYSMDEIMRRDLPAQTDLGNWWPQEEITDEQVAAVNQKADILVTHDAPYGVHVPGIVKSYPQGIRSRQRVLQVMHKAKPKLLVHGHYHVPYMAMLENTQIVGLGCNGDKLPAIVHLVDLDDFKEQ